MLTPGRRPRSRGMSSVSAPSFPPDLSDDLGDLPPRLPFQPHHPPLVRRVAAAAEAQAAAASSLGTVPNSNIASSLSSPMSSSSVSPVILSSGSSSATISSSASPTTSNTITTSSSTTSPLVSNPTPHRSLTSSPSSANHHPSSRRPRLLLRHRARALTPSSYLDSALVPSRTATWGDYTANRMPVMYDERADWDTPYDPSRFGGSSARRRLHTRRRRVSRLTDFLAWRVRRGIDGDDGENDSLGLTYEELLQLDDANVKCGLTNEELNRLDCVEATKEHMHHDCHICLENIHFGTQIITLTCKHVFHRSCIHTWLKLKRTCPICRCEL